MTELVLQKDASAGVVRSLATPQAPAVVARRRHVSPSLYLGGLLVALFLLMALTAPWVAPFPMDHISAADRLQAPGAAHLMGTDSLGRDLYSRILFGARAAFQMALLGVGISAGLGVPLGLLAGYRGGWADQILSRLVDILLALPGLLLAVIIVARLGPSLRNAALALGAVGIPSFYRLARSSTLSVRQALYVEAAQSLGATGGRIVVRHILPNTIPSLIVLVTIRIGVLILAGGGLSFIGLGAQPPQPEWGALLADGRSYLGLAPWLAWFPGLAITITVVGFNLLGDGLCTLFDPQVGRR